MAKVTFLPDNSTCKASSDLTLLEIAKINDIPHVSACGGEGNCTNNNNKSSPCTRHLELVCGCDGLTYSNPCVATNHGVNFYTAGACSD